MMHDDAKPLDEDAAASYEPPLLTTIGSVLEVTLTETDVGTSGRLSKGI